MLQGRVVWQHKWHPSQEISAHACNLLSYHKNAHYKTTKNHYIFIHLYISIELSAFTNVLDH